MKESKFIELLNLYIDKQISGEDAALLEEEITQSPRRRKIYSQYCRMHRACAMAFEQHEVREGAAQASERVAVFEAPRRFQWGFYATGLAAAAGLVLVAVQSISRSGGGTAPAGAANVQPAHAQAGSAMASDAIVPIRLDTYGLHALPNTAAYVADHLRLSVSGPGASLLAAPELKHAGIALPKLTAPALRPNVRPSIEDFVFARDQDTPASPKIFRPRQAGDGQEQNALEFQRQ